MPLTRRRERPRAWYVDGLAAAAFFVQAVALGRLLRFFPLAAIGVFAVSAGMGWHFARSAWRGLIAARR